MVFFLLHNGFDCGNPYCVMVFWDIFSKVGIITGIMLIYTYICRENCIGDESERIVCFIKYSYI